MGERRTVPLAQKPPLHRGMPGGAGKGGIRALLVHKPLFHRGKPGGGDPTRGPLLVQKPLFHRGEPGGDKEGEPRSFCAEVPAPPGSPRWGGAPSGLTLRFNYFGASKMWPHFLQVRSAWLA